MSEIDGLDYPTGKPLKPLKMTGDLRAIGAKELERMTDLEVFRTIVMLAMHNLDLGYKDARKAVITEILAEAKRTWPNRQRKGKPH